MRAMRIPISILMAGCLVAAATFVTNHWQISAADRYVYRLDRWTGAVTTCSMNAESNDLRDEPGSPLLCERK